MANKVNVWNRPEAKSIDPAAQMPLTAEQEAFRTSFAESLSKALSEHLTEAGAFITPGNNAEKGTLMLALSLPMPAIAFEVDGEQHVTRPWNLNVNATLPAPKDERTRTVVQTKALSFAELRAAQLAKRVRK